MSRREGCWQRWFRELHLVEAQHLPNAAMACLHDRRARCPRHVRLFDSECGSLAYSNAHGLTTAFRRHQEELGFRDLRIEPLHGFRTNFATVNPNELGADSRTLATLLSHASFKTTEDAHPAEGELDKRRPVEVDEQRCLSDLVDRTAIDRAFSGSQVVQAKRHHGERARH